MRWARVLARRRQRFITIAVTIVYVHHAIHVGVLMVAAVVMTLCGSAAAADPTREDTLKAAYLFNFAKFVEWPSTTASEELTVCFAKNSGVSEAMRVSAADKRIASHPIVIRSLHADETGAGCQVIYFDAADLRLRAAQGDAPSGALTVSDASGFIDQGGMIQMFAEGNRIHFYINAENARRAGIRISSNLMQLASKPE
jgi:hypothetical protein